MAQKGRKPKPTALKVLEGNPKHSYINHAIEKLGTDYKKYSLLPIPSDEMGLCADTFYQNSGW